jgi:hypothetical protein
LPILQNQTARDVGREPAFVLVVGLLAAIAKKELISVFNVTNSHAEKLTLTLILNVGGFK